MNLLSAMGKMILIVDDDDISTLLVKSFLERQGYMAISANCGEKALTICDNIVPDLILMDAMMPEMDGFECTQRLKQRFPDRDLRILMVSGLEDADTQDKVSEVGACGHIQKPINWTVLQQAVSQQLA
ncbi:MAG: PleD family two-component system response regulator [Synechococcus sp.]